MYSIGNEITDTGYTSGALRSRIILGTETFPADIDLNWEKVERLDYVIGDFYWTGWDYMGEAGIGLHKYAPVPAEYGVCAPWPCLTSIAVISPDHYKQTAIYSP